MGVEWWLIRGRYCKAWLYHPSYKIEGLRERTEYVPQQYYETEKITRKASDAAENLQLYRVVQFFCPRSSCTTHLILFSERRAWRSRVEEPNNTL